MRIYHHVRDDVNVEAADFAQGFVARKFGGAHAVRMYAALRVCGVAKVPAFLTAWSNHWYGHPEAIEVAATAFETTRFYEGAVEHVREVMGEKYIKLQLVQRCAEVASYTANNTAVSMSVDLRDRLFADLRADTIRTNNHRDDEQFDRFQRQRVADTDYSARATMGNWSGRV